MLNNASPPPVDELVSFIVDRFAQLRTPYLEWANLARLAIQGLPYDRQRLGELEVSIYQQRAELRVAIILASEHLDEEQLTWLRDEAHMSKTAWKSLKKNRPITIKNGFTLVTY